MSPSQIEAARRGYPPIPMTMPCRACIGSSFKRERVNCYVCGGKCRVPMPGAPR